MGYVDLNRSTQVIYQPFRTDLISPNFGLAWSESLVFPIGVARNLPELLEGSIPCVQAYHCARLSGSNSTMHLQIPPLEA